MQGRAAILILGAGIAAGIQERPQGLQCSDPRRGVERRPAREIGHVWVRAPGQQVSHLPEGGLRLAREYAQSALVPRSLCNRGIRDQCGDEEKYSRKRNDSGMERDPHVAIIRGTTEGFSL